LTYACLLFVLSLFGCFACLYCLDASATCTGRARLQPLGSLCTQQRRAVGQPSDSHSSRHIRTSGVIYFHSFVHTFLPVFIYAIIHTLMHAFVRSFVRSSVHSYVHSFVRSFIHSFNPGILVGSGRYTPEQAACMLYGLVTHQSTIKLQT